MMQLLTRKSFATAARARGAAVLFGAVACATAQSSAYTVVTQERLPGPIWSGWTNVSQSAADWNPLSRTSFGIQGPTVVPGGARVALFARGVVSPASQQAIEAYWPEAGINLTPLAATTLTPPSNCALFNSPGGLKVAPAEAQALLNLCAEPLMDAVFPYTVALGNTTSASTVGAAWPAMQSGWAVPAFNSAVWSPAYDSRYSVPPLQGMLHTFNLTRLAQKLVLRQSTDQAMALEFLRSSLLGTVIDNTFTIQLQACIILPQIQPPPQPSRHFIVTDVFEVYIHLIPGDGGSSENAPQFGCTPDFKAQNTLTTQASLIFDAGVGSPVVLSLGVGSIPTAVRFSATGSCGGGEVNGIALNPLYPNDPFCPYWLVFRPPGVGGPVTSIDVLPPTALPTPEQGYEPPESAPVPVHVLPPRSDAVPMFDCPPDWWNLAAALPTYL